MADRITQLQDAVNSVGLFICLSNIFKNIEIKNIESSSSSKVGVFENMYLIFREPANIMLWGDANKLGPR